MISGQNGGTVCRAAGDGSTAARCAALRKKGENMLEIELREHLVEELAPVGVFLVVPEEPPETYVVFERTGGGENNHLRTAVIALRAVAQTMQEAAELMEETIQAVKGFIISPKIASVNLNSAYNYTDTTKKEYRYQAVFDFVYYD